MSKKKREIVVVKAKAETGVEFYNRMEARRGTRLTLDESRAAARDAFEGKLPAIARASIEADLKVVVAALDNDPLGIRELSPETLKASVRLIRIGGATRSSAEARTVTQVEEREHRTEAAAKARASRPSRDSKKAEERRELIRETLLAKSWRADQRGMAQKITKALAAKGLTVSRRTVHDDLGIILAKIDDHCQSEI
jgi:hypothetical protein